MKVPLIERIINQLFLFLSRYATTLTERELNLRAQIRRQNEIIEELIKEPRVLRPNPRSYPYPPSR